MIVKFVICYSAPALKHPVIDCFEVDQATVIFLLSIVICWIVIFTIRFTTFETFLPLVLLQAFMEEPISPVLNTQQDMFNALEPSPKSEDKSYFSFSSLPAISILQLRNHRQRQSPCRLKLKKENRVTTKMTETKSMQNILKT